MKIHTINLAHRADRWARNVELGREWSVEFVRVPAIETPGRGWIGCALSHQLAVYDARRRGEDYVIVAEDDIEPTQDFGLLADAIALGHAHGFDAIYGATVNAPNDINGVIPGRPAIVDMSAYSSSHLTVYFGRAFEKVLRWPFGTVSDYGLPSGPECAPPLEPPAMKRGLVLPFLAIQRDDYSDICQRVHQLAAHWKSTQAAWEKASAGFVKKETA